MTYIAVLWLRGGATEAAVSIGRYLHVQGAPTAAHLPDVRRIEHTRPVDSDPPVPAGRQVERHLRGRSGGQRGWLDGTRQNVAGRHLHCQHYRDVLKVFDTRVGRDGPRWHGRLEQGTCGGQDGQRYAEGDGPQHDDILASPRKARRMRVVLLVEDGSPESEFAVALAFALVHPSPPRVY
jgi:hypothetical protein